MGKTVKVSGPMIIAEGMADSKMYDVVRVSDLGLLFRFMKRLRGSDQAKRLFQPASLCR